MLKLLSLLVFTLTTCIVFSQSDSLDKYILTPSPSLKPHINGAAVFGVRPGSPVVYKIAVSGQKPIHYIIKNLPAGLSLDADKGIISGALKNAGDYAMEINVSNDNGKDKRQFTIKVGNRLGLTPAMGWNSWNCWGLSVTADRVKSSAQALIDKGLIDYGWSYINIDDGWESVGRNADGTISANAKFPDMKALSDWLHAQGLKFGIYSSPGTTTCGGYLASYQHELQDATTYANWGVDYLKYDWCSYGNVYNQIGDTSVAAYMKPYIEMQNALNKQSRDIYYSLCQYGMHDVWQWGAEVNGNSWRTTGDINDSWKSLTSIWENQVPLYKYAAPGHWNDPDMLVVGMLGWSDNLHPSRLTPDEQYTHISLWCLLSAPLLIGCDISKLDNFTTSLLTNNEVLALDQDMLGKQARQMIKKDGYEVWVKELADGTHAIGIFNTSDNKMKVHVDWKDIQFPETLTVRDLWRKKDLGKFKTGFDTEVNSHGVELIQAK